MECHAEPLQQDLGHGAHTWYANMHCGFGKVPYSEGVIKEYTKHDAAMHGRAIVFSQRRWEPWLWHALIVMRLLPDVHFAASFCMYSLPTSLFTVTIDPTLCTSSTSTAVGMHPQPSIHMQHNFASVQTHSASYFCTRGVVNIITIRRCSCILQLSMTTSTSGVPHNHSRFTTWQQHLLLHATPCTSGPAPLCVRITNNYHSICLIVQRAMSVASVNLARGSATRSPPCHISARARSYRLVAKAQATTGVHDTEYFHVCCCAECSLF